VQAGSGLCQLAGIIDLITLFAWCYHCKMGQRPREHFEYEFFGPHGPAVIVAVLPLVVLALPYACNAQGCLKLWPSFAVPGFPPGQDLYTHQAMLAVLGWFAFTLLLHLLLPGQHVLGVLLPNRTRLTYKLNGEQGVKLEHPGSPCQGGSIGNPACLAILAISHHWQDIMCQESRDSVQCDNPHSLSRSLGAAYRLLSFTPSPAFVLHLGQDEIEPTPSC
jgi:hypothetical protein